MTERKRVAVVGTPGGWSSEALADAFERRFGERILIDLDHVVLDVGEGTVRAGDWNLCELDGIWVKKAGRRYSSHLLDRLEILRFAAESGVPVFSHPEKILRLLDRLSCTVTLGAHGIPLPPTRVTEDMGHALDAVRDFGVAVLKPLYSTKARGMELVRWTNEAETRAEIESFRDAGNPVMYIQKKIDIPLQDHGLVFLRGEFIGGYARVRGTGAWNTTIHSGGKYAPYDPSAEIVELARAAQAPFGLDFTSVDIAETEQGPIVFEVSAFGGFRGLTEGAGVDVLEVVTGHVEEWIR